MAHDDEVNLNKIHFRPKFTTLNKRFNFLKLTHRYLARCSILIVWLANGELCSQTSASFSDASSRIASDALDYSDLLRCGPNSLYVFMALNGQGGIRYDDLPQMPVTSQGTSLADLCSAAITLGADVEIRRYEKITDVPLPAIIHRMQAADAITRFHYDVVYKLDRNTIYTINGTTGEDHRIPAEKFGKLWMGYALVWKKNFGVRLIEFAQYVGIPIAVCVCCLFIVMRRRRSKTT
jgi:hypothetical protein